MDRLVEALELQSPRNVGHPFDPPGQVSHRLRRKDLLRTRSAAQPGSEIQGPSTVSSFHLDRFSCIEADPDSYRKIRVAASFPGETLLQGYCRPQGLSRGPEAG
jgi:hypothetical protein